MLSNPTPPDVCLFRPEIPQNTGNIGRLCAATQANLHLIEPMSFSLSEKKVRRAGLDYWPYLKLKTHKNIDLLLSHYKPQDVAFLSTKGKKDYSEIKTNCKLLVFGQETAGLPQELHESYPENFYKIPLFHEKVRSLNLANAVSVIVYEAWKAFNFQ